MEEKNKCPQCQKDIAEGQGVMHKGTQICKECYEKKMKQKRRNVITGGGALLVLLIGTGIALTPKSYKTFGGVENVNDSMSICIQDADSISHLQSLSAVKDTVSIGTVIDNIDSFKQIIAANIAETKQTNAALGIPPVAILFEINTNVFSNSGVEMINEFAKVYLLTNKASNILLEGHTCDLGSDKINDALSESRVTRVKSLLVSAGVPEGKIICKWYGKSRYGDFKYSDKSEYRRVIVSIK